MDANLASKSSLRQGTATFVGGSSFRGSYSTGRASMVDEMVDTSIRFGDEISFSQREGRASMHPHRSMVDVFLADDNSRHEYRQSEGFQKKQRTQGLALALCVGVVIFIIFISMPGVINASSKSSVESAETSNATAPTAAPEELLLEEDSGTITKPPNDSAGSTALDNEGGEQAPEEVNVDMDRQQALHAFVLQSKVSDVDAFKEGMSPQSQALAWLAFDDEAEMDIPGWEHNKHNIHSEEEKGIQLLQRYALGVLFIAMEEQENSRRHLGEENPTPEEIQNRDWFYSEWGLGTSSVCEWYGVVCNEKGHVTELNLSKTLLKGTLVPEVFSQYALPEMTSLNLANNAFIGHLPRYEDLPQANTVLKHVDLGNNHLTLSIDHLPRQLQALTFLDLTFNDFAGTLPGDTWVLMTDLVTLKLAENEIVGPLPAGMAALKNVEWFELDGNDLTGTIPAEWSAMTNMQTLKMAHNKIKGTIPEFFADFPLGHISLQDNLFTGEIPSAFGRLAVLREAHFQQNNLGGTMPQEVCDLFGTDSPMTTLVADCNEPKVVCECCTRCF